MLSTLEAKNANRQTEFFGNVERHSEVPGYLVLKWKTRCTGRLSQHTLWSLSQSREKNKATQEQIINPVHYYETIRVPPYSSCSTLHYQKMPWIEVTLLFKVKLVALWIHFDFLYDLFHCYCLIKQNCSLNFHSEE